MSTDDLVRRARALAAIDAPWTDRALVSELADRIQNDAITLTEDKNVMDRDARRITELADEVEQRKAERDAEAHAKVTALNALISALEERDAARAALERVRDIVESDGFYHSRNHIRDAIKEPS